MSFNNDTSLYEVLELKPDASPQEVREAYLRTKAAYNKDSVALYTLISVEEREEMLSRIQEAYDVLSNAELRREYDRNHGLLDLDDPRVSPRVDAARAPHNRKIISIDRVPPMESSANSESLLVAPSTDFTGPGEPGIGETTASAMTGGGGLATAVAMAPAPMQAHQAAAPAPASPEPIRAAAQPAPLSASHHPGARASDAALSQEISQEVEWKGPFLRRVRESRRISIEEMSGITKVGKNYLQAIEEESFGKLPAPVFLRGFITQIAKTLKLPHDAVVAAYMARFNQAKTDKAGR